MNAKHGGKTALHYAAAMGNVPVLKTLLEFHANLDAKVRGHEHWGLKLRTALVRDLGSDFHFLFINAINN